MDIDGFFERQLSEWPEVAERYEALNRVETKRVGDYNVQFNPARAVSTAAKVDAASIAARPCFLCAENRPAVQLALEWEDMEILVNPFPIFPGHLTIAAKNHTPQSMLGRADQMRRLSREMPGYTIFFNGAKSGASAPDHMHFQAVPSRYMKPTSMAYTYELPEAEFSPEEIDSMVNMVCTDGVITVIPRTKHRPDCYGDLLVSPASIDLCGTLIAVRRSDFDALDAARVEQIIREVTFQEPPVYVGLITSEPEIEANPDGTTTVNGIVIGKDFHWERRQTQRFAGEILLHDGMLINRIGIEEYLRSVISSEMSATSSLELLKAHAVISRSWLMAQLRSTRALADQGEPVAEPACKENELRLWFDRDDHDCFDVCSDDHCQRYQGLTRITSPAVDAAIEATRGLVLSAGKKICDARFSKCCGGAFERFESCWQPARHSYLRAGRDAKAADLPDLTEETNAREWILGRPKAFCANTPAEVLGQVLNDFDRQTTPDFYRWTVCYTQQQLSELIARRSGIDFGVIQELRPLQRGSSGRIVRLEIVGTKCSRIVGKELIIRRWLSESHLYSSAFVVERQGSDFVLRGAGWGHGVGLCQIGAAMMADKGYDFREILQHYYPEAELWHAF
ncbi:MAG: DUF4922 domain-containing protein [Muribaculaceae bacterium]|nr:DUF4922 domain-containing protein [Muribaculaceae bacterium]